MSQTTILRPRAIRGPTIEDSTGASLTFDALLSESATHKGTLTKHPVEEGADVSDHYQDEPDTLALTVGVTNSPDPSVSTPQQNRDIVLYDDLVAIKKLGEPITVVTGIKVYPSFVITSVAMTRDPSTGQALALNIDLEELIITTTETVDIPQQRRKAGRQNPDAVAVATAAQAAGELTSAGATAAASTGPENDPEAIAIQGKQTGTRAGSLQRG